MCHTLQMPFHAIQHAVMENSCPKRRAEGMTRAAPAPQEHQPRLGEGLGPVIQFLQGRYAAPGEQADTPYNNLRGHLNTKAVVEQPTPLRSQPEAVGHAALSCPSPPLPSVLVFSEQDVS